MEKNGTEKTILSLEAYILDKEIPSATKEIHHIPLCSRYRTQKHNDVRALLVAVQENKNIAGVLCAAEGTYVIHSPEADSDEEGPYLSWKSADGKTVTFVYQNDTSCKTRHEEYERCGGGFYALGAELIDHFPKLTYRSLAKGMKDSLEHMKEDHAKQMYRTSRNLS